MVLWCSAVGIAGQSESWCSRYCSTRGSSFVLRKVLYCSSVGIVVKSEVWCLRDCSTVGILAVGTIVLSAP